MPNIKKNFFYNSILTTANYVFPLIVFPYITRVLGVSNIGICDFVDSIINYFCIFSMLGMSTVGVREIAGNRSNKAKMSKVFSSLLSLNMITTGIMTIILMASIFLVPMFQENSQLMWVGVFKLLSKAFLMEWLYTGVENFKYITARSIVVRSLYVVAVFIFVRTDSDYLNYYVLTTLTIVINAIINTAYSKRFVSFSFKGVSMKPYIKPVVTLGIYSILTSMYTTFNVSYLGFIGGNTEVGYYSTATRLHNIILALFTAFTGVMLPRMASLLSEGDKESFQRYVNKSINILFAFAFPVIVFCIIYADQIVRIIAGQGYEQAVPCMRIIMPLLFVIGYEQIMVIQILMPLKRDADILKNSIVGASVGVLANLLIVPRLMSMGSAIVWCLSEIAVLIMAQFFVNRQIGQGFNVRLLVRYLLYYLPVAIILCLLHKYANVGLFNCLIGGIIVFAYFLIVELLVLKDDSIVGVVDQVKSKLLNKHTL